MPNRLYTFGVANIFLTSDKTEDLRCVLSI